MGVSFDDFVFRQSVFLKQTPPVHHTFYTEASIKNEEYKPYEMMLRTTYSSSSDDSESRGMSCESLSATSADSILGTRDKSRSMHFILRKTSPVLRILNDVSFLQLAFDVFKTSESSGALFRPTEVHNPDDAGDAQSENSTSTCDTMAIRRP